MRHRAAFAAVVLVGVVSACSDDDDPSDPATAGTSAGGTPSAGSGGAPGKSGSGQGGDAEAGAPTAGTGGVPLNEAGGGGVPDQAGANAGEGGLAALAGEGGQAGATSVEQITVEVTPEAGGDISLGDASVHIPAGAVSEAVMITLQVVDPTALAPLPAGGHAIGPAIALLPHGLTFATAVTITLAHSGDLDAELAVLRLDDEADESWAEVADPDFGASQVSFQASTFSIVVPVALAVPGDVIALRQFGSTNTDSASAVVFDHQGNLIVGSRGPFIAPTSGDYDGFVHKFVLEPGSQVNWNGTLINTVASTDNPNLGRADDISALCVDNDDNIFVVGDTNGVLAGPNNSGALDGYVRKISPAGVELWTRQIYGGTNTRNDRALGVAADSEGNVFVTGAVDGLGNNPADAYVRKLDPNGGQLWHYDFTPGSATYDMGVAVAVAPSGDPVVLGWTAGDIDIDSTNAGADDFFVSMLDADTGMPIWTKQHGTAVIDCAWAMTVDSTGDVLVAGQTGTCTDAAYPGLDSFVMKLKGTDGSAEWQRDVTTPGEERARAVAVDPSGNVLVAGHSTGSFDSGKNLNAGKLDVYVRKLSPDGDPLWTNLFGNAQDQRAYGVAASSSGLVAVVGITQGELASPSAGGWDAFIAWLKP